MEVTGNLIEIDRRAMHAARLTVADGRIASIEKLAGEIDSGLPYLLPGLIDAHIHIESSMLVPSEFARLAVRHGTVATVSDPHEIANVAGIEGIDFMIADAARVALKVFFGAPSCVPATPFETSGATIDAAQVAQLLQREDIYYLAEMMNYPGVLADDPQVMQKLAAARNAGKPIDGHAPGLKSGEVEKYVAAGISTDHECTTLEEAESKLALGMKILIREGSAAKNFDALWPLIDRVPDSVMLCSDDKHPDELAVGHIDELVRRGIDAGCDLFHLLRAACLNPISHYELPVGRLRVGDPADFIVVSDLERFVVDQTYIDGQLVADRGRSLIPPVETPLINQFGCSTKSASDFASPDLTESTRAIEAIDGSLQTRSITVRPGVDSDVAKLAVVNRYRDAPVATCFVRGFGIRGGAIASSVGHDSHNLLAVGDDDDQLCRAVNALIEHRGGIAAVAGDEVAVLPLPIGGIMTSADGLEVAEHYRRLDEIAKARLASPLTAPFMTLSFMALLVIPSIKLSDRGLFDSEQFRFVEAPCGEPDS